ncbi:hypothetical protein ACH4GE_36965 [Streptomyces tendae]|uniref:hypothetical protein n=1 Tax=Streptomyces tendae TaxID=1932 RepID=UPI0037AD0CE6
MLEPASRRSGTPDGNEAAEERKATRQARNTAEPAAAAADGAAEASSAPTASAPAGSEADTLAVSGRTSASASSARSETRAAVGGAPATATAVAEPSGPDEPPSGNPKKPLRAAAGMAGAVLLAVPLLIWASSSDDERPQVNDDITVANGSETLIGEPMEPPKSDYAPAEPAASASPSSKASAKEAQTEPKAQARKAVEPSATPDVGARTNVGAPATREPAKLTPARITAAQAVQQLSTSSPGRHICYQVRVKEGGWLTPSCDGANAGEAGKPVIGIKFAVSDANGVKANEHFQQDGWVDGWTGQVNGLDLAIGSADKGVTPLNGFTISVGSGNVCQKASTGGVGGDWHTMRCSDADKRWVYGGSTQSDEWLEVISLTV